VARVLIVGCGCRGRSLAQALAADGHAVRGTTRSDAGRDPIAAAGAEPVVADPDRLGTLLGALDGVGVVCWLMASAAGSPDGLKALHGPRLRSLLERLVDTPVRGVVYESRGTVDGRLLDRGAAQVEHAGETFRLPVAFIREQPERRRAWVADARAAVGRVLSG
jgi:nucleoside-diphosphate-sugar epimerase